MLTLKNQRVARGALLLLLAVAPACKRPDPDEANRRVWLEDLTKSRQVVLRQVLNGNGGTWFYDGWFPIESDPKTGGAWRWQEKKSTTRFRTSTIPPGDPVRLSVFGWTDYSHLDVRTSHLDFFANGVRVDRFDTPATSFEHVVTIPRRLIGNDEWFDFSIVAANTAKPAGEWRDLGFATTGFIWRPEGWKPTEDHP